MNPAENKQPESKPEPETPTVTDDLIGAIGAAVGRSAAEPELVPEKAMSEEVKSKAPRKKKIKEERPPLPDETQAAADLPKPKREAADYDISNILADDSEEEDLTEALPTADKITTKLPKSKYIQVRPGREHQLLIYTIKLDDDDQRPGQLTTFVLDKKMVSYFRDELEYTVTKTAVHEICTIQGQSFMYVHSVSTDLSNNSYNTSHRDVMREGEKGWVRVRTDQDERKYKARKRRADLPPVAPAWSKESLSVRFMRSLGDMYIKDTEHPITKRLNGEEEGDEEGGGGASE